MRTTYDWSAVQAYYDEGHSSRECQAKFGMCPQAFNNAVKRGSLLTRSLSEAMKLSQQRKPRKHSEEAKRKMSEHMKQRHAEGTAHTLGHNRHLQEPSYPEKWWLKVLQTSIKDQDFVAEYRFHRYSIDFAWPVKKVALEIDGEQHRRFDSQIESDARKDQILEEHGWTVCRIPWKECCANPSQFVEQVKNLVDNMVTMV